MDKFNTQMKDIFMLLKNVEHAHLAEFSLRSYPDSMKNDGNTNL